MMASTNSNNSVNPDELNDDDDCVLPADTLLILQQFLKEKALNEHSVENGAEPEENWQLSQFWYNEQTKKDLALIVKKLQEENRSESYEVALLSAPSAFKHVANENSRVILFEFDERFALYGDNFHQYDYNKACDPDYLNSFSHRFDLVIADPPFLSEECIEKMGIIIKKIVKSDGKIVLCSGAVVQDWAKQYLGVDLCEFRPEHERNLGNEFRSYANFDLDRIFNKDN